MPTKKNKRRAYSGGNKLISRFMSRFRSAAAPQPKTTADIPKKNADCKDSYLNTELYFIRSTPPDTPSYKFTDSSIELLKNLYAKTFHETRKISPHSDYYEGLIDTFEHTILTHLPKSSNLTADWETCMHECYIKISAIANFELNSTVYILRSLLYSLISVDDVSISVALKESNIYTREQYTISDLTGVWTDDKDKLEITGFDTEEASRLIMGFGPSASGKTRMTSNIITLLTQLDEKFPKTFIAIDGGILREASLVYQIILTLICKYRNYPGLNNLVNSESGGKEKGLFSFSIAKKHITNYLLQYFKWRVSIYVPTTLTSCGRNIINPNNCLQGHINNYINITNDTKWIGIYIWQHKNAEDCTYINGYKCYGCERSGKEREISEGKKYNSLSWSLANILGLKALELGGGGYRFKLHNTGKQTKSDGNPGISILQGISGGAEKLDLKRVNDILKPMHMVYCQGKACKIGTGFNRRLSTRVRATKRQQPALTMQPPNNITV